MIAEIELNGLRAELTTQRPNLGTSEIELALAKARELHPEAGPPELYTPALEFIDDNRAKFLNGARVLTSEQWRKVYTDAENSARAELLANSGEQKEVVKLLSAAEASRKLADQADAQLQSAIREFFALPDQAGELSEMFARIESERSQLNRPALESEYRRLYKSAVLHPERDCADGVGLVQLLVTLNMRLQVLSEVEKETEARFAELEARNSALSKKLGRPAHKLRRQ